MDVVFYTLAKKRNSTKRPTGDGETLSCKLKDNTSMLSPSLELALPIGSAPLYNYCYIAAFRRYYYVEWESESARLWIAHCTEDVLATYRASIGASTKYILRCASSAYWDGSIIDEQYPQTTNITLTARTITENLYWNLAGSIIIGIVGPTTSLMQKGSTNYYLFTQRQAQAFFAYLMGDPSGTGNSYTKDVINKMGITGTSEFLATFNPLQYIVSCKWFPIAPASVSAVQNIWFGKITIPIECSYIDPVYLTTTKTDVIAIPKHPQAATRGAYLNVSASRYQFELQPFGIIDLPGDKLVDVDEIDLTVKVDFITGNSTAQVSTGSISGNMNILGLLYSNIACDIPYAQITNSYLSAASAIVSQVGGAVVSGNPLALSGLIGNVLQHLTPHAEVRANAQSSYWLANRPSIIGTFANIVNPDDADNGRPCCKNLQISALSGYVLCDNGEINVLTSTEAPPTESELSQISSFLTGGFYYE